MTISMETKEMAELLPDERACLCYLMNQNPADVPVFIEQIEQGRKGILHKLASAVLREDIDGLYSQSMEVTNVFTVPFSRQLSSYPFKANMRYILVDFVEYAIVFPVRKEYSFRRVETVEDILYVDEMGVQPVETASGLVKLLFKEGSYPNLDAFIAELDNGTANLTLALAKNTLWKQSFDSTTTLEYVQKQRAMSPTFSASLFFEQLVLEGHHLHPGAKTKLGLSFEDVLNYSPEFHQPFGVRFVALHQSKLVSTQSNPILEDFPNKWAEARRELHQKGFDPALYEVLPVHPWQFEHAIPTIYQEEIDEGNVVVLDKVRLTADATSSFRSVSPHGKGTPVLKLAVNSQMTSTVRSISTQTALNSTVFTDMMNNMLTETPIPAFVPLNETKGAAFRSTDELKSRNLTMLVRESIDAHLEDEEIAVAGMALYATSPMSGKTVLQELVQQSGMSGIDFFERYIRIVIPGYLKLMVKYGVALEGHLQNSVPVFKHGRLSRFFFRDWGGARVYRERLEKQGLNPGFAKGSVSVTEDLSEMHNKLYYTVFQNHLGEIIRQLENDESEYWEKVKTVCDETFDQLKQEGFEEEVATDRSFLYQPTVMHKSLTKMRLTNRKSYDYTEVPNPLA